MAEKPWVLTHGETISATECVQRALNCTDVRVCSRALWAWLSADVKKRVPEYMEARSKFLRRMETVEGPWPELKETVWRLICRPLLDRHAKDVQLLQTRAMEVVHDAFATTPVEEVATDIPDEFTESKQEQQEALDRTTQIIQRLKNISADDKWWRDPKAITELDTEARMEILASIGMFAPDTELALEGALAIALLLPLEFHLRQVCEGLRGMLLGARIEQADAVLAQ